MIYSVNDEIQSPQIGEVLKPEQAMQLAISEAQRGAGFVSPNPLVGCVIVDRENRFLAAGYHEKYGEGHAEANALKKITNPTDLEGATVYVTLEPCAHQGKTPSCAKALAKYPLKKVIYGLQDPNPLVSGQGAQILKTAGIKAVEYHDGGELKNSLNELPEVFLKNFTQKKIFVAAKLASSLDGQIALSTGESKWITGPESREFSHELRSRYDAIIVGKNTILQDDPSLNIRHPKITKATKLVIMDRSKTIFRLIQEGRDFKFFKAHSAENIIFPKSKTLAELQYELWGLGLRSAFVEGGGELISEFLKAGLVDRLHLFMAPIILGSGGGLSWTKSLKLASMDEKLQLKNIQIRNFGTDFYLTGRF